MSIELKLLALLLWTVLVAGSTWAIAKTRYELRESKQATQALVVDKKRSQRADGVAGEHAEWQQKHAASMRQLEAQIETTFQNDSGGWAGDPIPAGVRASLAAAAAAIVATEYADTQLPGPGGARPGHQPGSGPRLGRGAGGLEGMPRAASAPH